jgi:hypothetical protein
VVALGSAGGKRQGQEEQGSRFEHEGFGTVTIGAA